MCTNKKQSSESYFMSRPFNIVQFIDSLEVLTKMYDLLFQNHEVL